MISGLLAACSSALAAAAVAVPAAAASTRYAAPAGTGPAASCAMADPCSLEDAVEAPEVGAGGVVVLAPGTYALGDRLDIDDSISVGGAPGAVPVIAAATPGQAAIAIDAAGAELHDATVLQGAGEPAIQLRHGLVDRVSASGDGAFTCELGVSDGDQSLLRDSVCWSGPAASGASAVSLAQAGAGLRAGALRNVVAWASGSGGAGLTAAASGGGTASLDVRNVIASGSAADVVATAAAGSTADVALTTSNFAELTSAGAGATSVTPPSQHGNQAAAPLLADPGDGDFAELPGSPTIDAGSTDPLLGDRDLGGAARIQGPVPDIGADERDGTPPRTTIDSGPAAVVRDGKVTFTFRSDEPGSTFSCRIDDGEFQPCTSPYTTDSLEQGDHVFAVRATDSAGNVEPTPAERLFGVDKVIAGANVAARGVQRIGGGRVAIAITVRAGEFTRVWAAGSIAVGKKRYRIESGRTTLVAGQVRRLLLRPVKPRASRRIRKAIRHRKRARALLNATFVDLIGNRATSGEVDVKLKRRRGRR